MLKFRDSPTYSPLDRPIAGRTVMQIVPDLQSGGAERSAVDIAQALSQAGARSLVASRGGRMVSELQAKGGVWLPFPAATKNPFAMALNSVRLARIIRDEGVDIVHARSRAPAWVAYYAARQARARFITTYHSAYSGTSPIKLRYNAIMAAGDMVIANSQFTARRIARLHPEAAGRIAVIPRGVDLRQFSPFAVEPQRVERLRADWGVEPHQRVVLLPARLTARKGHFVLIEAAKRLVAQGFDDVRFIFVGDARSDDFSAASIIRSTEPVFPASCARQAFASTCPPPISPRRSPWPRRRTPKPSAASPWKRRRWARRSSSRTSARPPKSCWLRRKPARIRPPDGVFRRPTRGRSRRPSRRPLRSRPRRERLDQHGARIHGRPLLDRKHVRGDAGRL